MAHSLIKASSNGERAESSDPLKLSPSSSGVLSTQQKGSEERAEKLHFIKFQLLSNFCWAKQEKISLSSIIYLALYNISLRNHPYVTKCYLYLCACEFKFYWEISNLSIILPLFSIKCLLNKLR